MTGCVCARLERAMRNKTYRQLRAANRTEFQLAYIRAITATFGFAITRSNYARHSYCLAIHFLDHLFIVHYLD